MRQHATPLVLLLSVLFVGACLDVEPSGDVIGSGGSQGGQEVSFALDILPLFEQDCILCHGGAGGLSLESYEGVIAGGRSGAVVIPGNGTQSLLPRRLDGTQPPIMPLDGIPLTSPEIERIRLWIDEGAQGN